MERPGCPRRGGHDAEFDFPAVRAGQEGQLGAVRGDRDGVRDRASGAQDAKRSRGHVERQQFVAPAPGRRGADEIEGPSPRSRLEPLERSPPDRRRRIQALGRARPEVDGMDALTPLPVSEEQDPVG